MTWSILVVAIGLLPAIAAAQDYRLPPSMRGPAEKVKPEVDYRIPSGKPAASPRQGPSVRIHNLTCSWDFRSMRGIANGQVENISGQPLNQVEVTVYWRGLKHGPVSLKPMPMNPGERLHFNVTGSLSKQEDCNAVVSAK